MPNLFARVIMFVSAYAPLLGLFAVLESFGRGWPSILCGAVAVGSTIGLVVIWIQVRHQPAGLPLKTVETRPRNAEVLSFFVTYVVPFAAAQDGTARTRWALLLFVVIVAVLYLRAGLFYANPLLALAGFRVFELKTDNGRTILLLTRSRFMAQKGTVESIQVSTDVHVEPRCKTRMV